MILYHGTSAKHLDRILKEGIRPRDETGNSNWEGKIVSKAGFVYLTTAYPVYFAFASCEEKEDLLILEVDAHKHSLYPDEDYIARCLKKHDKRFKKFALNDINTVVSPEDFKAHYKSSLDHNGLVCTRGVKPERIKRHVVIPHADIRLIMSIGGDSMPIPINYLICGKYYRKCVKALFDKGVSEMPLFLKQNPMIPSIPEL